jgi:uncharacterized protein
MGGVNPFPIVGAGNEEPVALPGTIPRISSLLIKPASALCNLDCTYCFYLDRALDPYRDLTARTMSIETLERLVSGFLFYSYPNSVFAFQGGEPTLAGLKFFEKLVEFQKRYGRDGQNISNALQTNSILIDDNWARLFHAFNWLLGVSLDGPQEIHDTYRLNKGGQGTWKRVMQSVETLKKRKVEFNILCVLSEVNVRKPKELYKFWKQIGVDNVQYIPLSEFDQQGNRLPFTVTAEDYGRFLVDTFDLWWPDRRKFRIRFYDNLAEALAGQKPGACTMHDSCDSYVVVEYNGDIYPCDFFVEGGWKLGNINSDSWPEVARRQRRFQFAGKKSLPHPACQVCEWQHICKNGCPKFRHSPRGRFGDLDYFCQAYKMIYSHAVDPLQRDVDRLLGRRN